MRKFRVLKSSIDGLCGGESRLTLDEACSEIITYKGWDSIEQLREAIRKWGKVARAGSVFKTQVSAIVAAER